ncbi:MAG TPA: lipocalin-like domain-containing protein [Candidatus Acidoferrum sp.]|nr:lipocalin-like domain-containing protein [Candidatus Acidoferrum sp.]
MRSKLGCTGVVIFFAVVTSAQYRDALPGYRYQFPRDHFNHPDFQTEWWYYTGNVKSAAGRRFGFELTFFRQVIDRRSPDTGPWDVRDLYLANLALSDLDGRTFLHAERTNRAGPGIAGANIAEDRIWNGNWEVRWQGAEQVLQATDERFALRLTMQSAKPPVIQGQNGVSQKGKSRGRASHYISLTRLDIKGAVQLAGTTFEVTGTAWMDHEFFTHQLDDYQVGWDWMSVQLQDNTELMLYHIRRKDGSIDPYSAGTFVDASGSSTHLRRDEFNLEPAGATWTSPDHAVYPIRWKISVPRLGIKLECSTLLPSQEVTSASGVLPAYWEGAIILAGTKGALSLGGVGYLEMTGYDRPMVALR